MKKIFLCWLCIAVSVSAIWAQTPQEKLPDGVIFVAEKAEDVIDLLLKEDWAGARAVVDKIGQHQAEVQQEMRRNKMPDSLIEVFGYFVFRLHDLAKEKKSPIQAALSANQITALLIDLQSFYAHKTPLEIARLDYLGREIVLLAQVGNNYGLLAQRLLELEETWDKVKPDIQARQAPKGETVASRVTQVVAALRGGGTNSQMVKNGKRLLDLVDGLEALFK